MVHQINSFAAARVRLALALCFASLGALSGCGDGGGSGGGGAGGSGIPTNQAPSFTSATSASVAENTTGSVYQAIATDPDGDALTYSIAGGADAGRFTISSGGQLSFVTPPNYDLPTDADGNNSYEVQISVSDGKSSTTLALTVAVTNLKEGIAVHRVATGFTDPVAIAPSSDTAMLVAEKAGAIYLLNPQTGTRTLLYQIASPVSVLALAVAPSFATDGTFFVMYRSGTALVLHRFGRNPAGPTVPDNFGPILVLSAPQYAGGGWLGYDANGNLLAATGDAGGTSDPNGSAQNSLSRLGKLLRIAPNPDPYGGVAPEFFLVSTIAQGLHQPNGGGLLAGNIVLADHGQDLAEELDIFASGSGVTNFGWPFKEGTRTAQGTPPGGLTDPVLEYFRTTGLRKGQAIIGGAIGPTAVASLKDQYVFGDGSGAIFSVPVASLTPGKTLASEAIERRDADFAPDNGAIERPVAVMAGPGGTLYVLDADGDIFRVDAG